MHALDDQILNSLMRLELKEAALGSRMVWDCATCYQCQQHCPQGVPVTDLLYELRGKGVMTDIIFLHASDEILLQRYGESRRRHPLAEKGTQLRAAIASERNILNELQLSADLIIDTSRSSIYELADIIRSRVDQRSAGNLSVLIESFGFKHGVPADADFVFDARALPNPYWVTGLRSLTGREQPVIEFLESDGLVTRFVHDIRDFLDRWIPEIQRGNRSYLTIAVGCTGGQHRSVYVVDKLAGYFRDHHHNVTLRHTELPG